MGAFIPGFIHIEQALPRQGMLRCGGAVALFAAVWLCNPAKFAIDGIAEPPTADATPYIKRFIAATDAGDEAGAYAMLSDRDKATFSFDSYRQLVGNVREPLKQRSGGPVLWNTANPDEIPGRKGPFVFNAYQSTFTGMPGVWVEVVGVVAEKGVWKLHAYTVGPCLPPVCRPVKSLEPLQAPAS